MKEFKLRILRINKYSDYEFDAYEKAETEEDAINQYEFKFHYIGDIVLYVEEV